MVYGRKQASIHTHVRNAVTLVWGSLRLTPKKVYVLVNVKMLVSLLIKEYICHNLLYKLGDFGEGIFISYP